MFRMVRLAGVSAVLAAAFVLATTEYPVGSRADLLPRLTIVFEEAP
ncbi:hypothetical protein [Enterovirga aerilata]|uniref:Uncharacterized protein n=1 Tax=Enterovirga aerilata TaxID=2730920 RepID=A0A849I501_9HYPH|nr:hypothetical protein [Enterovirga sp. DB1703]NNM74522.1 hypothetical protein [Enterovirga sp. DB1703]